MLVVLVIIGLILAVALPSLKGIKRANVMANANRQLLDDLAWARQKAIVGRTTVHFIFVPTNIFDLNFTAYPKRVQDQVDRLKTGEYTAYAMLAERSVGDQPGQNNSRYVSAWKSLPEGVLVDPFEFNNESPPDVWKGTSPIENREFLHLPLIFPSVDGLKTPVPQIAFGPHGGLVDDKNNRLLDDEVITLTRGSILFDRDNNNRVVGVDAKEISLDYGKRNTNWIRIDGLTGRANVVRQEIQ
jgi:hypothetical protein